MAAPDSAAKQKVESKPMVENKAGGEPPEKSHKLVMILGLLLVLSAAGLGFFAFPYFKGSRASAQPEGKQKEAESLKHEQVKATLALDPFLVNLADTDEIRFVKATFQLGLSEEAGEETKDPVAIAAIRDSIISLLTSKTAEQILTPKGKEDLRREIRDRINTAAPESKVVEIYIVDFVVQL